MPRVRARHFLSQELIAYCDLRLWICVVASRPLGMQVNRTWSFASVSAGGMCCNLRTVWTSLGSEFRKSQGVSILVPSTALRQSPFHLCQWWLARFSRPQLPPPLGTSVTSLGSVWWECRLLCWPRKPVTEISTQKLSPHVAPQAFTTAKSNTHWIKKHTILGGTVTRFSEDTQ